MRLVKNKYFLRSINYCFIFLVVSSSIGCSIWSLDDQYHYTYSYRIKNQTENLVSGILMLDSTYYSNPAVEFEVESKNTIEVFWEHGGDGPNLTPSYRKSISTTKLHINSKDSIIVIDVSSEDMWEYTTEKNKGVNTFSITQDLF